MCMPQSEIHSRFRIQIYNFHGILILVKETTVVSTLGSRSNLTFRAAEDP